jgi:glutamate synthase (NADPH/NADH) large chain
MALSSPLTGHFPAPQGLYDPSFEHDACGLAVLARLDGQATHAVVADALTALAALDHRGARGAEPGTGDGAGITIQIPDRFYRREVAFDLPPPGSYATGLVFLPRPAAQRARGLAVLDRIASEEGLRLLGWRAVPTDSTGLGKTANDSQPCVRQLFVAGDDANGLALERLAYCVRKRVERETAERGAALYFPSLSARTIVYKGMLTPEQLATYYPDLTDERVVSALAVVHSRFATNTFPSWALAHPFRLVAHNGEINTIRGNRNWFAAREALLATDLIPGDLRRLYPICAPGGSDSASFDDVVELLHLAGRELPHALLMMVPQAWENDATMPADRRAFYQFHASLMEPWDGPACIAFTNGIQVGAVLDRSGLRPGRWSVTTDGVVVLASEAGVLPLPPDRIRQHGRLRPGQMFLVDIAQGRIIPDDEIKDRLAAEHPYAEWVSGLTTLAAVPAVEPPAASLSATAVATGQLLHGYTSEELKLVLHPMATDGIEPVASMGMDTPIAARSRRPRVLFDYFTQMFAQVTNPPLDAIREELVTSLAITIGPEANLLAPGPDSCRQIMLPRPVLEDTDIAKIESLGLAGTDHGFRAIRVSGLYPLRDGAAGLKARLTELCRGVSEAIEDGVRVLILSDRDATADLAPIPSLLLTAAIHQHLVREQTRTRTALVVEAGDCRQVHHLAALIGYGAAAVNPYLALATVDDGAQGRSRYLSALAKGLLKVMSKMGICTVSSYCGAQVFEAVGLDHKLVERYFTGTSSRIGGIDLAGIHEEVAARHALAFAPRAHVQLPAGGEHQWRRDGELHLFNPETVFLLQHATRSRRYDVFGRYTRAVDELAAAAGSLRGLLEIRPQQPIPIDEVEPVSAIVARFATGAMSYGSISAEAHETLAIAMNRLGGRSNSGEGGEESDRLTDPLRRSAVKQVASGRFGVTSAYLTSADDIQIKMAQGAKPGEGGQLPGSKVWPWIAKARHATPGVGLISPPPHHDIYSIEDLAQLIFDLRNVNPTARVHVKLVSEVGVGTVAAGVAKAKADVILISGHDGGTGAAPLGSLQHAGLPWELGLAETQQTLRLSGLRDRVTIQVDGQLKTGRDVVIAALLGAEEFGFATAPLIVSGCVMMRVCHLDTCPVGIATQDPQLRKRFTGEPQFVQTFFEFLAEQVRETLAALGLRTLDDAVGRVDLLDTAKALAHWKDRSLDLAPILHAPAAPGPVRRTGGQDHDLDSVLDVRLIEAAAPALTDRIPVRLARPIRTDQRSVGAMLGGAVTRRYGEAGLPDNSIDITFTGAAGQSFGAFAPRGVTLRLHGQANDYLGKGLSGGRLVVRPPLDAAFAAEQQVIAGNTVLYGATGGELLCRGQVGERFAVRNSGAVAVVEGLGDHGCEYMTGGTVVVLGPVGRNFGAGMSGGLAYVWRLDPSRVNAAMVDVEPVPDLDLLRSLLVRHRDETGSPVAAGLLDRWGHACTEFSLVIPREYRRHLADQPVSPAVGVARTVSGA